MLSLSVGEGLSTSRYFHIMCQAYSSSIGFLLETYEKFLTSLVSLLLENLMQGCFNKIGWDRKTDAIGGCIGLGIHRGHGRNAN